MIPLNLQERFFNSYLPWVPRIGLSALLLYVCLDFGGHHYRPEALFRFATFIITCFWLLIPFRKLPPIKMMAWPLTLFLAFSCLSAFCSSYFHDSFLEWLNIVCFVLIFIVAYDVMDTPRLHYVFIHYALAVGGLMCLVGIYYKVAYSGTMSQQVQSGMHSTFYQADVFGGYLVMMIPLAFVLYLFAKDISRSLLYGFFTVLYGVCLVLTFSRGAWISLFLALTILFVLALIKKIRLPDLKTVAARSCIALIVLAGLVYASNTVVGKHEQSLVSEKLKQRTAALFSEGDSSRTARLQFWKAAVKISLNHPFLGTGLKTFGRFYPPYEDDIRHFSKYAHNLYAQFLAEMGWIATMLFLAVIVLLFWRYYQSTALIGNEPFVYASHVGIGIGALAGFMHHFVDVDWFFAAIPATWAALFAVSMRRIAGNEEDSHQKKDTMFLGLSSHMAVQFGLCMVLMVLSLLVTVPFLAQRYAEVAEIMRKSGRLEAAEENYRTASRLDPFNSEYLRSLADILFTRAVSKNNDRALLEQSERHIRGAIAVDSHRAVLHHFLGKVKWQQGACEEALKCYEKALSIDGKNYPGFYNDIATYYLNQNEFDRAEHYYQEVLKIFTGDALKNFWFFRRDPTVQQLSESYLGMGNIYLKKKRFTEAEVMLKKSLEFQKNNFSALFGLGYCNFQLGKYPDALILLNKAQELDPRFALTYLFKGLAYDQMGDRKSAEQNYKKANELDPNMKSRIMEK